jgi:phage shock protein C
MNRKLYRSRTERKLWGVCGGLAKYFDIDPVILRVIFVASLFVGSLGFWAYIILALVVPLESETEQSKGAIKPV